MLFEIVFFLIRNMLKTKEVCNILTTAVASAINVEVSWRSPRGLSLLLFFIIIYDVANKRHWVERPQIVRY